MITLLITCLPHSHSAKQAIHFAKTELEKGTPIQVFFYGDGAYVANGLCWQTADVVNNSDEWLNLSKSYGIKLPVCVSTALARGVCDDDNAKRHALPTSTLKEGFSLVGLSEFAMMITQGKLVQFS